MCAHGIPHTNIFFKFRGEQSYQKISKSGRSTIAGGGRLSALSGPFYSGKPAPSILSFSRACVFDLKPSPHPIGEKLALY